MNDDPDRNLACQEDLQDAFDAVAVFAEQRGWSERQISKALLALAVARIPRIVGVLADTGTQAAIAQAVTSVRRPN